MDTNFLQGAIDENYRNCIKRMKNHTHCIYPIYEGELIKPIKKTNFLKEQGEKDYQKYFGPIYEPIISKGIRDSYEKVAKALREVENIKTKPSFSFGGVSTQEAATALRVVLGKFTKKNPRIFKRQIDKKSTGKYTK